MRALTGARSSTAAVVALLAVTAAWGSTFVMLKGVVTRVPVPDFLAVRFVLAGVVLFALQPRAVTRLSPTARRRGMVLGAVYGVAQILQTVGLEHTSASVSGFITGMYVVFTPLLGALVLRQRLGRMVWVAVAASTLGVAMLSLRGLAIGPGELLTLVSAVLYAVHILGLGAWTTSEDAFGLSVVQMGTISLVCALGAVPGGITLPSTGADWAVLVFMALVAGAFALVVQTWAQAHLAPTRAAIIMSMEPVWAATFAVLLGGEQLGPRTVLGGALVVAAMYLVELGPRTPPEPDVAAEVGSVTHVGPV
ncbi:MAG TPA: DMT family transporter [Motilibacteraceae bacterium]|nr:DMT family transporter [Motilibacteraceae bacterium]